MSWMTEHWRQLLPLFLGAISIVWLMPKGSSPGTFWARLLGLLALGSIGLTYLGTTGELVEDACFFLFSATAAIGATLVITHRNPVYSALWFAIVTLSVCGLFLLQSAPFLASATVIVYAGAIVVTFLFVLMLAQQAGITNYDQNANQPTVAVTTGFVLLSVLFLVVSRPQAAEAGTKEQVRSFRGGFVSLAAPQRSSEPVQESATGNRPPVPQSTSQTTPQTFGTMRGLGRSLFGDYLFAVELAGTLLLVAAVGAIVIAPKRSSGKL
jgi:NADH-quinone oxidoreductase subunit J